MHAALMWKQRKRALSSFGMASQNMRPPRLLMSDRPDEANNVQNLATPTDQNDPVNVHDESEHIHLKAQHERT